jgi:RHS repeat-associated protein
VTADVAYDPYGSITAEASTGVDDFRPKYGGGELDPAAGLYHFGAREYAPDIGRFVSPDAAGQYASPYAYAGDDPASYADPSGDFAILVALAIGALVGAYFGAAALNHDPNPLHWNWRSGKTYAGLLAGAAIGAVGAAAGGVAVEAGLAVGALGGTAADAAGVAIGIAGQAAVGAGENAAYAALGGGSAKEVLEAAAQGAVLGAALGAVSEAAGPASQELRRAGGAAEESAGDAGGAGASAGRSLDEEPAGAVCGASFVAGTPVLGTDGRLRPIEGVRRGDRLAGRELDERGPAAYPVTDVLTRTVTDVVDVTFAGGGGTVTTTPEHPFRLYRRGWIGAKDLAPGDQVTGVRDEPVTVTAVAARHVAGGVRVHNVVVAGAHDYYAGRVRVLVHNPANVCYAEINAKGVYTEHWNLNELRRRYPNNAHYQAVLRDIRFKARSANKILAGGPVRAFTRALNRVRTASREWVAWKWRRVYGIGSRAPNSIRTALGTLRAHPASQDVDEYLTRLHGGVTVREGMPENQGPLNSFVNQTSGSAAGALSRRVNVQRILRFRVAFDAW